MWKIIINERLRVEKGKRKKYIHIELRKKGKIEILLSYMFWFDVEKKKRYKSCMLACSRMWENNNNNNIIRNVSSPKSLVDRNEK